MVDDREEADFICQKYKFMQDNAAEIREKLIPRLQELADNSNGALLGPYLFPEDTSGSRYPKR